MKRVMTKTYCLGPNEIRALERDGLGWGHDVDCGCVRVIADDAPVARGLWSRIATRRGAR